MALISHANRPFAEQSCTPSEWVSISFRTVMCCYKKELKIYIKY